MRTGIVNFFQIEDYRWSISPLNRTYSLVSSLSGP